MDNLADLIDIVLDQSQKAFIKNEIPVGAIIFDPITKNIISRAHNQELSLNDPTAHAEILCIRRACKKLNQKRLDDLELITYLEPCAMCKEVIKSSRLKKIYYLFKNDNPRRKTIKTTKYQLLPWKKENLIKKFFQKKRINN